MSDNEQQTHLWIRQKVKSLLIRRVGFLKVILHEVTVAWIAIYQWRRREEKRRTKRTQGTPDFAVVFLKTQHTLEVFDSLTRH